MDSYEERFNKLSNQVAQLREVIWEKDKEFCEMRIGEMVCFPESCMDIIIEWVKHDK